MSKRIAKLNELFKRELAVLIRDEVRDHRVGPVTITGVDVARDLGSARVFVRSVDDEALPDTVDGLNAAAPFLRSTLGRTLRMRRVPELRFREDRSLAGARRIEEVLSEVLPAGEGSAEVTGETGVRERDDDDPSRERDAVKSVPRKRGDDATTTHRPGADLPDGRTDA